jgi:NAD(P)-dependent dehydrogenase (short-subunit alcohol dehydrogenase family)
MKNMVDQLILITGSTDGLGKGTALALAKKGATVILHGRDRAKLELTKDEIRRATGNTRIESHLADLSSLAEVRRLAVEVQYDHDHLDLLINNAGIGFGEPGAARELSRDGHELRFAVNYLAPFLLTNLLVPCLRRGAPSRIVNVASAGQEPIDFTDVMLTSNYDGIRAYRRSKTALVMFTFDLARKLANEGITANSLHPGTYMDTKMVREARIEPRNSVQVGIDAVIYLATSQEIDGITGMYFNRKEEDRAIAQAYDERAREELWGLSEKLTGLASK